MFYKKGKVMQKKFVCLLLCLFVAVGINASDPNNLIILNDVTENFEISLLDEQIGDYGAITTELSQALLEAEDPILCAKALLQNLFFLKDLRNDLCNLEVPELVRKYIHFKDVFEKAINFGSKERARIQLLEQKIAQVRDSVENFPEDERRRIGVLEQKDLSPEEKQKEMLIIQEDTVKAHAFVQEQIEKSQEEIDKLQQEIGSKNITFAEIIGLVKLNMVTIAKISADVWTSAFLSTKPVKEAVAEAVKENVSEFYKAIPVEEMRWVNNDILAKIVMMIEQAYLACERIQFLNQYKSLTTKYYTCKEVNDDFLLFVPNKKGGAAFNLANVKDFDSSTVTRQQKVSFSEMSKSLRDALDKIFSRDQESAWNVLLSGHGSPQETIAEIPIVNEKGGDSLFVHLLNFFNYRIPTKNLMVISCYPGGEKIETAFDITSEFDNPLLANLNYTLIFEGAQPTVTYITSLKVAIPPFHDFHIDDIVDSVVDGGPTFIKVVPWMSSLLNALDNRDYLEAEKAISLSESAADKLNKTMLIKLPHQEWMQPVDFAKDVKKLSQVQALTAQKDLVYSEKTKILLLSANHIPATINFTGRPLPMVVPTTHLNYNFYFKKILSTLPAEFTAEEAEEAEGTDSEGSEGVQESKAREESSEDDSESEGEPKKRKKIDRYIDLMVESFNPFFTTHLSAEPIYFFIECLDDLDESSVLIFTGSEEEGIEGSGFIVLYHESRTAEFGAMRSDGRRVNDILVTSYSYEKAEELVNRVVARATGEKHLSITEEGVQNVEGVLKLRQRGKSADIPGAVEIEDSELKDNLEGLNRRSSVARDSVVAELDEDDSGQIVQPVMHDTDTLMSLLGDVEN